MANRQIQLDTTYQVVTPENISFEYRIAGPFRRLPAYLMDWLVRAAILFVMAIVAIVFLAFPLGNTLGLTVLLVTALILAFFYGGLFEAYWNGQTPGKWVMGIRVVSADGSPITGLQAVLRNLLRFVDSFPLAPIAVLFGSEGAPFLLAMTYQVGLFSAMMNPRYQRVGDIVCGTVVIVEEKSIVYGVARVDEPEVVRLAAYMPMSFDVTKSLAKALSSYVERRRFFPPGRRADIAKHLGEPLRLKFNLPPGTSHDLILCALYYRAFIADQAAMQDADALKTPFAAQQSPRAPLQSTPAPLPPFNPTGTEPVYEAPEIVTGDR